MTQRIDISYEESEKVEELFSKYNAYLNILSFFGNKAVEEDSVFDRKWAEAVEISMALDKAKRQVENKYKPAGNWDRFQFDFENHQVVFERDETRI